MAEETTVDLKALTAEIVASHVANNRVHTGEVPILITSVYAAMAGLGVEAAAPAPPERPQGAVSARKSLGNPAHILSMIDGKPYQTLKRHITRHGYTPESYREAFGLAKDYPMVAEAYRQMRSALAQKIGLGRKPIAEGTSAPAAKTAGPETAPKRRDRVAKALGDAVASAKQHLGGE